MIDEPLLEDLSVLETAYDLVAEHCAMRLRRGELGLILGAGVSLSAGFQQWGDLVNDLLTKLGLLPLPIKPTTDQIIQKAEEIKSYSGENYVTTVRDVLYAPTQSPSELPGKTSYEHGIDSSSELRSIASVIRSQPFGVTEVITFNFDTYLDDYLRNHGVSIQSIDVVPRLYRPGVRILHAHGLVGRDSQSSASRLVFSASEYQARSHETSWWDTNWRFEIKSYLTRYQPLFVGIGGSPDAWHEDIQYVSRLLEHVTDRAIIGFWLLGYHPGEDVLERIRSLNCAPVIFPDFAAMYIFIERINQEAQASSPR